MLQITQSLFCALGELSRHSPGAPAWQDRGLCSAHCIHEASLLNRGGALLCCHLGSARFKILILLNKGLMDVLEFVFPSFSALAVRD